MQENEHEHIAGQNPEVAPAPQEAAAQGEQQSSEKSSTSKQRIFQSERRTQRVLREAIIKIKQGDIQGLAVQDIYELHLCHKNLAASSAPDQRLKTLIDETVKLVLDRVDEIQHKRVQSFIRQCWPDPPQS